MPIKIGRRSICGGLNFCFFEIFARAGRVASDLRGQRVQRGEFPLRTKEAVKPDAERLSVEILLEIQKICFQKRCGEASGGGMEADVDDGREASPVQLRLRDISGIIIIDFIDMDESGDKEKVIETLKEELRKDRTKSNVLGITQLGLVEMTRKKSRKCISNVLQTTCPYCNGSGRVISAETMLLKVRKKIMRSFATESCTGYLLQVHPDIAKMIYENTTESAPILPREQGRSIWIQQDSTLHIQEFHLTPITSSDELKSIKSLAKLY